MSIFVNQKYRIKRSAEHEEKMRYLIQEIKIFEDYSQILMLSAIIGYNNNLFVPFTNYASDGVQIQFFTETDYDIIDFIAYGRLKQQSILKDSKKYEIFENYAYAGFPLLVDKLGIDFIDKNNNDRLSILKKLYALLLANEFNFKDIYATDN